MASQMNQRQGANALGAEERMTFRTIAFISMLGCAATAGAQAGDPAPQPAQQQEQQQQLQQSGTPAAVGEAAAKPTRGFFSSLGHNLADDVKHIPRRNSAYWMAGGAAAALAVHPIDHKLNEKLVGHS